MARTVWKFRSLYFAFGVSTGVFFPYISVLLTSDGVSSETVGLLVSIGILASMVAQPVWGLIGDKYHSARLILLVAFVAPAFFGAFFDSRSVVLLGLVTALLFITKVPQTSVANAYTLSAIEGLASAFGRIRLFQSFGFGIGGYLTGLYLSRLPLSSLWVLYAGLCAVSALLLLGMPRMRVDSADERRVGGALDKLTALFRHNGGRFALFLLGAFLINQTLPAFNTYLVIVFRDYGGSISNLGWAIVLASAGNVVSMIFAERLSDRIGTRSVLLLAALIYTLRWVLQYFIVSPTWIILVQLLHGSFGLFFVPAVRYVDGLSAPEVRVTSQAVFGTVGGALGLSGIVGNALEGFLLKSGGPQLMYGVSALGAFAGALCFAYIRFTTPARAHSEAAA